MLAHENYKGKYKQKEGITGQKKKGLCQKFD